MPNFACGVRVWSGKKDVTLPAGWVKAGYGATCCPQAIAQTRRLGPALDGELMEGDGQSVKGRNLRWSNALCLSVRVVSAVVLFFIQQESILNSGAKHL